MNRLLETLFLLRKVYLTKTRFHHYGQFAEDVAIGRLFPRGYTGFYVDVGCFHPKKHSNTWRLHKQGWRGVNVDIDPIKIRAFDWVRRGDWNVASAVSDEDDKQVTYFSRGIYSLVTTLDAEFAKRRTGYVARTTVCRRLTSILDESPFKDRRIDFLTVDAEAHDLEVVSSLDFTRYRPRLVAVESHLRVFGDVAESPLYRLLVQRGYGLVGWCGLTLLMADGELQQALRDAGA